MTVVGDVRNRSIDFGTRRHNNLCPLLRFRLHQLTKRLRRATTGLNPGVKQFPLDHRHRQHGIDFTIQLRDDCRRCTGRCNEAIPGDRFKFRKTGDTRATPEFNLFFDQQASYPYYSDAIWVLTQMRRWGQIAETKPDAWYLDTAKAAYRPDLYTAAAKSLVADGKAEVSAFPATDGFRVYSRKAIDGVAFDARQPAAYAASFAIGLKSGQTVTAAGVK